jgi:hypothetical protein
MNSGSGFGQTFSGVLSLYQQLDMTQNQISNLPEPTNDNDVATKKYVDTLISDIETGSIALNFTQPNYCIFGSTNTDPEHPNQYTGTQGFLTDSNISSTANINGAKLSNNINQSQITNLVSNLATINAQIATLQLGVQTNITYINQGTATTIDAFINAASSGTCFALSPAFSPGFALSNPAIITTSNNAISLTGFAKSYLSTANTTNIIGAGSFTLKAGNLQYYFCNINLTCTSFVIQGGNGATPTTLAFASENCNINAPITIQSSFGFMNFVSTAFGGNITIANTVACSAIYLTNCNMQNKIITNNSSTPLIFQNCVNLNTLSISNAIFSGFITLNSGVSYNFVTFPLPMDPITRQPYKWTSGDISTSAGILGSQLSSNAAIVSNQITSLNTSKLNVDSGLSLGTNLITCTASNSNIGASSTNLITKSYADSTYLSGSGYANLTASNTFTGNNTNTFNTIVRFNGPSNLLCFRFDPNQGNETTTGSSFLFIGLDPYRTNFGLFYDNVAQVSRVYSFIGGTTWNNNNSDGLDRNVWYCQVASTRLTSSFRITVPVEISTNNGEGNVNIGNFNGLVTSTSLLSRDSFVQGRSSDYGININSNYLKNQVKIGSTATSGVFLTYQNLGFQVRNLSLNTYSNYTMINNDNQVTMPYFSGAGGIPSIASGTNGNVCLNLANPVANKDIWISTTGAIVVNCSQDLKESIINKSSLRNTQAKTYFERIHDTNVYTYMYINDNTDTKKVIQGYLFENLIENEFQHVHGLGVVPDGIQKNISYYDKSCDYKDRKFSITNMIPYLHLALQDAYDVVEQQKVKLNELQTKYDNLIGYLKTAQILPNEF